MCYDHLKYGRIPRDNGKARMGRLCIFFSLLIMIGLAYCSAGKDYLQDQPTAKEKAAKLRQEKEEAAALALFEIPTRKQGGK